MTWNQDLSLNLDLNSRRGVSQDGPLVCYGLLHPYLQGKPLDELLEDSAKKMDAQRAQEEAARKKQEDEIRLEQQKEAARLSAEDALLRMEHESDAKILKLGANAACADALSSMLAASVGVYRGIIEGLESMVTSIAAEPADLRLRLIRIRNEGFQERLGRQPGVWQFLRALGFQAFSREELPSDMVTMLNLSSSPPQERFLLLKEPDMMNAYEEWTRWHKRLLQIAQFLQELGKLAFQRIAHLGRRGDDVAASEVLSAKELLSGWENAIPSWEKLLQVSIWIHMVSTVQSFTSIWGRFNKTSSHGFLPCRFLGYPSHLLTPLLRHRLTLAQHLEKGPLVSPKLPLSTGITL